MKRRGDGRNKGLKVSEQKDLESKISVLIENGYSDADVMLKLNLQPHVLKIYKNRIAEKLVYEFKKMGPQGILEDYARKGRESIRDLEELIIEMKKHRRTHTAITQAIRQQNKIVSDVIRLAHELGLIPKRTRTVMVNGTLFSK